MAAKCYIDTCELLKIAKDFVFEQRFGIKCEKIPYCKVIKHYIEDLRDKNSKPFGGDLVVPEALINVIFDNYVCQRIEVGQVTSFTTKYSNHVCQRVTPTVSIPEVKFEKHICHVIEVAQETSFEAMFTKHTCHKINTSIAYNAQFSQYVCEKLEVFEQGNTVLYNEFVASRSTTNQIKYGNLYNGYAVRDPRKITSSDVWQLPEITFNTDWNPNQGSLFEFITIAGGIGSVSAFKNNNDHLTGDFQFWDDPNTGASNLYNVDLRGTGFKTPTDRYFSGQRFYSAFYIKSTLMAEGGIQDIGSFSMDAYGDAVLMPRIDFETYGYSIRLVRPATPTEKLSPNGTQMPDYIGNDGRRYKTVLVGNYVWLAEYLIETKFRNLETIPLVNTYDDDYIPTMVTTPEMYHYDNYQGYTMFNDIISVVPEGWHIPTINDLLSFIGTAPELLNLDSLAYRESNGTIVPIEEELRIWLNNPNVETQNSQMSVIFTKTTVTQQTANRRTGLNIRLVKNDNIMPVGNVFIDREGNEYPVQRFNNKIWMVKSLIVKTYQDATDIPLIADNTAWSALNDGAYFEVEPD